MSHYIYNKEGARIALGLKDINEVNRYEKNAINNGNIPYKIIGGEKLYDIDILLLKPKLRKKQKNQLYTVDILNIFKTGKLFAI